jgi:transcriptional regulator with XRE-family HTH domain
MITPSDIRERATQAHSTLQSLLEKAGIDRATFWRWENDKGVPHPVTVQKVVDALDAIERERAAR